MINQINKIGIYIILALPLFTFSPWMYPADFPKTLIFRSILAIMVFAYLLLQKKPTPDVWATLKSSKIVWALIGLLGIFFLASIFSVDSYFSFWGSPWRGGGFVTFAFYFIFAILTFFTLNKQEWQKIWDFPIFIGVLVSLSAIFQYFSLFSKIISPMPSRPASTLGNPILLAIYILLLFFITLSFFIKENIVWKKVLYAITILIFTYTIFISGTRAVWLGIFVGFLYFLLFYPQSHAQGSKKPILKDFLSLSKVIAVFFIIAIVLTVAFINLFPSQPKTSQNNRFLETLENRLSIKNALNDERYQGWKVALQAIADKPILGWGPENFAIGFDKNYDPKILWSLWWDKAHNVILDIGVQTGILGILIYITLFVVLFWQLQKNKKHSENPIIIFGLQATLISYFTANLFSFDSFGTYLIFFLIISYTLHLTNTENINNNKSSNKYKIINKNFVLIASFIILIFFLYQYNLKPFLINTKINIANYLAEQKDCNQALSLMEQTIKQNSFLNSYIRMEYIALSKKCGNFYPENNLTYIKTGKELILEAVKIQPTYTRYWLYLASANNALAQVEKDALIKKDLLNQANIYLQKALELAPKHQEIFIEQAKVAITSKDYKNAVDYSEKCIELSPKYANCYWYLAIAQIYSNNTTSAKANIQIAKDKGYNINHKESLDQLSDAYGSILDYKNLVEVYKNLILYVDPNVAQYHSSLAFLYRELGLYKEARAEALRVIDLSPESKANTDAFLKTLPK